MQIRLEEAYALACQKVGEAQVREAILSDMLAQKDATIAALKEKLVAAGLIEEAEDIIEGASHADRSDEQQGQGADGSVPRPPPSA